MRLLTGTLIIALLAAAAAPASAGDSLGRLFMTPDQRRALDALREAGDAGPVESSGDGQPAAGAAEPQVVLNGVVRRRLGPDVVWVNGSRSTAASGRIRLRQGPDAANRVTLEDTADGGTVRLKPGQFWEPATGRVADCYGCGTPAKAPSAVPDPAAAAAGAPAPAEATAGKP